MLNRYDQNTSCAFICFICTLSPNNFDHNVSRQGSLQQVQAGIYKTVDKANGLQFSAFSLCFLGFLSIINCDSFQVCKTRFVESLKLSAKNDLFKCWIDTIRIPVAHLFALYALYRQITLITMSQDKVLCNKFRQAFIRQLIRQIVSNFQLFLYVF